MSFILSQLRLIIEYGKTEVFHFSRLHELFDSLPVCYGTLWTLTFFFFFYLFFLNFIFIFIFLLVTMKGHMTLQSYDMSHDVMS